MSTLRGSNLEGKRGHTGNATRRGSGGGGGCRRPWAFSRLVPHLDENRTLKRGCHRARRPQNCHGLWTSGLTRCESVVASHEIRNCRHSGFWSSFAFRRPRSTKTMTACSFALAATRHHTPPSHTPPHTVTTLTRFTTRHRPYHSLIEVKRR